MGKKVVRSAISGELQRGLKDQTPRRDEPATYRHAIAILEFESQDFVINPSHSGEWTNHRSGAKLGG